MFSLLYRVCANVPEHPAEVPHSLVGEVAFLRRQVRIVAIK